MPDRANITDDEFTGKVALITGASSGIGETTALEMARRKAKVIMLVRSSERGEQACKRIREEYPAADLQLELVDLSLMSSVVGFCSSFKERIDILVNNAGVFAPPYDRTKEGVETVLATNHLGHFLLTCLLLSNGRISSTARLVLVTGAVYKRGNRQPEDWNAWTPENYHKMQAYRNSKLAICLFTLWLRSAIRRLLGSSAKVFAVHPGVVSTEISRHILAGCIEPCRACLRFCMRTSMLSPLQGCQGILRCAADHDDGCRSGSYFNNCRLEAWHKEILDEGLMLRCWDFSFELVHRSISDVTVVDRLKKLRELPRDTLDDLA